MSFKRLNSSGISSSKTSILSNQKPGPALAIDPFQANVVYYLNGDSLTDKTGRHALTAFGSAGLSTTVTTPMLSGRATQNSIYTGNTTSDYINVANNLADFDWSTSSTAWTVEFWIYDPVTTPEKYWHIFVADGQNSKGTFKGYSTTGARDYGVYVYSSTGGGVGSTTNIGFSAQSWHHVAITKSGSTGYLWLDGVLKEASSMPLPGGTPSSALHGYWNTESAATYMDEFRVTRAAKYGTSGNFTPRMTPYIS
jgi:hypothetical protein